MSATGNPNLTERAWSEEVAIARATERVQGQLAPEAKETAYVFSNGRRFVRADDTYALGE